MVDGVTGTARECDGDIQSIQLMTSEELEEGGWIPRHMWDIRQTIDGWSSVWDLSEINDMATFSINKRARFPPVETEPPAGPRWKEHILLLLLISVPCLCDSSLMPLSEINRAFNFHSSGSSASNYGKYAIKHSKYQGSHGIIMQMFGTGKSTRRRVEEENIVLVSAVDSPADPDSH